MIGELPTRTLANPNEINELVEECPLTRSSSQSEKHESSSSCFGKRLGSLKRGQKNDTGDGKTATYPKSVKLESKSNRSLPRTLKMQEVGGWVYFSESFFTLIFTWFYRECEEYTLSKLHYTSDRNLVTNSTKKSYEMIYCPERRVNDIQFAQNRMLDDSMSHHDNSKVKRQTSFGSNEKKSSRSLPGFTSKVGDSSRSVGTLWKCYLRVNLMWLGWSLQFSTRRWRCRLLLKTNLHLDLRSSWI